MRKRKRKWQNKCNAKNEEKERKRKWENKCNTKNII